MVFKTARGLYELIVIYFGLCNSPATFQAFMEDTFYKQKQKKGLLIYMDNLLIIGQTIIELQKQTKEILQVCRNHRLSIKIEKYMFHRQEVEYLGLIIKPNHIVTNSTKLKGILKWPLPKKPKDIHRFLGFCGFYRKFI